MDTVKIDARDVNFWYGDFHALKGISMQIEEKSVVAFIGPSGCGKMSDAGVRKGFIILKANDQPMRKVSDLEEVMKAAVKSPNQVLFLTGVFPSGKRGYFAVDLTQE